ncbi:MAG TPA: hypothetical protein VJW20_23655 [Candidatus Angelobacter sp.]|nr:hypothetical protein [Candidatus Angelobacter sp.]
MRKFIGWLGGIAATVIAGYVLWYLTNKPAPPAPAPSQAIIFEGMVIDGSKNLPLQKAMVSFQIDGSNNLYHQVTDENGAYRIDFTDLTKSSSVVVNAEANGFNKATPVKFARHSTDNHQDFLLTPVATAPPPPVATATPHPLVLSHPPVYIRRAMAEVQSVKH